MKIILYTVSVLLFICIVLLLIYFDSIAIRIHDFACRYFAADHSIQNEVDAIRVRLILLILGLAFLFIVSILLNSRWCINQLQYFFLNNAVMDWFMDRYTCNYRLFFYATISSVIFTLLFSIKTLPGLNLLYGEDNFFEWLTVVLLLFSFVLLIRSSFRLRILKELKQSELKVMRIFLAVLAVLMIILAMEEISWGQRIFNWHSPDFMFKSNFQKETNLHNFFNPVFKILYPLFGYMMMFLLIIGWIPARKQKNIYYQLLFPHQNLFICAFMIMISTRVGHSDLFEQLMSLFFLFYSTRITRVITQKSLIQTYTLQ